MSQNYNKLLSAVKDASYITVNKSTKPALPSRKIPPLGKVKVHYKPNEYNTPCVNDKDEDIEVYTELS